MSCDTSLSGGRTWSNCAISRMMTSVSAGLVWVM